jgi:hypothetical protein
VNSDESIAFPVVIKKPEGYKSREVYLANSERQLRHIALRISRSMNYRDWLKDQIREFIHKGFVRESRHRKKMVVQEYIPGLQNDWKVLVFGDKYYPLLRQTRKNDFRASGSGLLSFPKELPDGMLDTIQTIVEYFNVPQLSADIGYDGNRFYIFELQFIYFGTYTIEHSQFYFMNEDEKWIIKEGLSVLEEEYAGSIMSYLKRNNLIL